MIKYYVPGSVLFSLHTEQGFSVGLSLRALQSHPEAEVHWFSFFSEAAKKGWKTYQVHDMLQAAYQDDPKVFPDFTDTMHRLMLYASLFDNDFKSLIEGTNTEAIAMKQQIEDEVQFLTAQHACDTLLLNADGVVVPVGVVQQDNLTIIGKLKWRN